MSKGRQINLGVLCLKIKLINLADRSVTGCLIVVHVLRHNSRCHLAGVCIFREVRSFVFLILSSVGLDCPVTSGCWAVGMWLASWMYRSKRNVTCVRQLSVSPPSVSSFCILRVKPLLLNPEYSLLTPRGRIVVTGARGQASTGQVDCSCWCSCSFFPHCLPAYLYLVFIASISIFFHI